MNDNRRCFNTAGACNPQFHYMVDIQNRLEEIKKLVDAGKYFTINRARQYGKTTTIKALAEYLENEYVVVSLDFQRMSNAEFADEYIFSAAFVSYFLRTIRSKHNPVKGLNEDILNKLSSMSDKDSAYSLGKMFAVLSELCEMSDRPIVLIIDEVDSATNNQIFLDFLAQLRSYFLDRENSPTFWSVILAGVYDVKNIRKKIRADEEHKVNSPWNIASDFRVNMSFTRNDIGGMLEEYEADHHTGMVVEEISSLIFDYTSGYPFLVSRICKLMDEEVADSVDCPDETAAWTKEGFLEAVKLLLSEKNTLFESLIGKLYDYPSLKQKLYSILFGGKKLVYNPDDPAVDIAMMFGFVKNCDGTLVIANRIFEMRLYNYFLTTDEAQNSEMFIYASDYKPQFIQDGHLNMELVLKKFTEHFDQIYSGKAEIFDEAEGRRRFLLYLRPIINGTGNYYIEPETRNSRRMDVVVDYNGEQFIIELKIWRGETYHERGEKQLSDYLDYFQLKKGYMLSYNFNAKKETGVVTVQQVSAFTALTVRK